ncbi:MAG: hypothetical protein M3O82_07780 [Verrucomicrobiota bacterium]|nr:hypothetical protein [Verrucomicrobiota bacterium]
MAAAIMLKKFAPLAIAGSFFTAGATALAASSPAPESDGEDHMREELGVNNFTTPSIQSVLTDLDRLKPIPFEFVQREIPQAAYTNRAQLALNFGALIADGFLIVAAENRTGIEKVGTALLKEAKVLGVGDYVTRHSQSLSELAAHDHWSKLKDELIATQSDIEKAMIALHDEELAHLVSLGGWLRGLEMTSAILSKEYDPAKAAVLSKKELADYFIERLESLNPSLRRTKLIDEVFSRLQQIREKIAADTPVGQTQADEISELAKQANLVITTPR